MAWLHKKHGFTYDVDKVVSYRLERHAMDGADVVVPFTGRKDVQNRFDPAPVWNPLTISLDIFDIIAMYMWTFQFSFLNNAVSFVSSISRFSAILTSEGKIIAAFRLDTSIQSSEVEWRCARCLVRVKTASQGPQLLDFRLLLSGSLVFCRTS